MPYLDAALIPFHSNTTLVYDLEPCGFRYKDFDGNWKILSVLDAKVVLWAMTKAERLRNFPLDWELVKRVIINHQAWRDLGPLAQGNQSLTLMPTVGLHNVTDRGIASLFPSSVAIQYVKSQGTMRLRALHHVVRQNSGWLNTLVNPERPCPSQTMAKGFAVAIGEVQRPGGPAHPAAAIPVPRSRPSRTQPPRTQLLCC